MEQNTSIFCGTSIEQVSVAAKLYYLFRMYSVRISAKLRHIIIIIIIIALQPFVGLWLLFQFLDPVRVHSR
jgi:hypothetical protein